MKILVIEDDVKVAQYIEKGLHEAGHNVHTEFDGKEGFMKASSEHWDVLVVDRMLPSMEGLNIIKSLRSAENYTPAIILSALGEVKHRVEGLRAGSDDYLAKPFAFSELLARIDVITRRSVQAEETTQLTVSDLELNLLSRKVTRGGRNIKLLQKEFALLEYMMRHADQVVTRTMLLEAVWNYNFDPQTNVVDVHISRLRNKIDIEGEVKLIQTIRGAGYVIRIEPETIK